MQILFADLDATVIDELEVAFMGVPNVMCQRIEIGQACSSAIHSSKAVINPGNCHSLQDGGFDGAVSRLLSTPWRSIEGMTQKMVDDLYMGQQPIGTALMVPSPNPIVKFMVYTPTMMVPEDCSKTFNAYTAFRAALLEIWKHNLNNPQLQIDTIICPGLVTGAGSMEAVTSAKQMRLAWDSLAHPVPHKWKDVWNFHHKLSETFETMS